MKRIEGVAVGLVSEVDAKLGRVKVTFPWMDPPQKSYWAPIASLLSGKKRGARFMPEPKDEALIAFDRGQFDHPYVIGFLWNGADEAPDNEKTNRIVVTPGGHQLRFEDKDGDRRIVLKTSGGHTLTLDDKTKSVTLKSTQGHYVEVLDQSGKVTLATASGGKVILDDQPGTAVVEASHNRITLDPQGIAIEAPGTVNIRSTGMATLEAQGVMNVKSSAVMNVETTAAMNIKATAVLNIDSSAVMNLQASGLVNVTASFLSINAPLTTFSGVVQAPTVIATSVVSTSYTPGVGNIW